MKSLKPLFKHYILAAEMSAIASFMSASNRDTFPKQVSSHAINSYINCNKPNLAIKCALITLEAVRASGGFIDAAKDYLKEFRDQVLIFCKT